MGFIEIFLIGVALSMDAFAVSVCKGLSMNKVNYKHALLISIYFGGFQALMPFLGYILGSFARSYIEKFDHWVAFGLLLFIGINMIKESFKNDEEKIEDDNEKFNHKEILILAIATSIDALAVGIAFAMDDVNILFAITVIGITTFIISFIGVAIGNKIGSKFQNKASIAGGVVLILIGLKILLEHLNILNF